MTDKTPKISVIMPVYNTAKYLNEAINSILNQSFTDFEFIIIDDCSTDGSLEIIKSYKDERIILIQNEINKGYVFGLNYAISIAKGKYIARMDSDDISIHKRLKTQWDILESDKEMILCGSNIQIVNSSNVVKFPETHKEIKKELLLNNIIAHPSVMIKKASLFFRAEPYVAKFMPAEDYELWTCLIFQGKFYNIQTPLLEYRKHENQISNSKSRIQHLNFCTIKRSYLLRYCYEMIGLDSYINQPYHEININLLFNEYKNILRNKKFVSTEIQKFLLDEIKELLVEIFSLKKNNSISGLLNLLKENPNILFTKNIRITLGFLKRVIYFTLNPGAKNKSVFLR